jgi:hypothetical protein
MINNDPTKKIVLKIKFSFNDETNKEVNYNY